MARLSKNIPKLTRDEQDLIFIKSSIETRLYIYEPSKVQPFLRLIESIKFPSSTHLSEKKRYVDNLLKAFLIGIK